MGEVILGLAGPWAADFREKSDQFTTKIGGLPDWPIPETSIQTDLLNCHLCKKRLCLVAQVYAPLLNINITERVLCILGCTNSACASNPSSWRALRAQKFDHGLQSRSSSPKSIDLDASNHTSTSNNSEKKFHTTVFGDADDDDECMDLEALADAFSALSSSVTQTKKQSKSSHKEAAEKNKVIKTRADYSTTPVLPCFYTYQHKVQPSKDINNARANYSSLSFKENGSSSSGESEGEAWEGEVYEYDSALGADRTYLKFKKQLDVFPDQCFRYSYGGSPLLPTTQFEVKPDPCKSCGSPRIYEMQLLPSLLYFFNEASDDSSLNAPEEWSWLTLLAYTCSKSCARRKNCDDSCWYVVEEAVIIQDE